MNRYGWVMVGLGALMTLFPYRSGGNPSDGLGILLSWLASEESFRQRLCWPFLSEGLRLGTAMPIQADRFKGRPDRPGSRWSRTRRRATSPWPSSSGWKSSRRWRAARVF